MKNRNMPVLQTMCPTCPFREGSKTSAVAPVLVERVLSQAGHICHSTGGNNAFNHRTGREPALCRGARNVQLATFHAIGFIEAPTDEAWNKKREEFGMNPITVTTLEQQRRRKLEKQKTKQPNHKKTNG